MRATTIKRHELIRKAFNKLRNEKYNNKPVYTYEHCIDRIAEQFGYSAFTIEKIIQNQHK